MSILTIFLFIFYVNIVSCDSNNPTAQYDNFTIQWQNFDLLTCAVPTTISISLFSCLPPANYTQVDDVSCLQQTTMNFDSSVCQATSIVTGGTVGGSATQQQTMSGSITTVTQRTQMATSTTGSTSQTSSTIRSSAPPTAQSTTTASSTIRTTASSITRTTQPSSTNNITPIITGNSINIATGSRTQTTINSPYQLLSSSNNITTSTTTHTIASGTIQTASISTDHSSSRAIVNTMSTGTSNAAQTTSASASASRTTLTTAGITPQIAFTGTIQASTIHTNDTSHATIIITSITGSANQTATTGHTSVSSTSTVSNTTPPGTATVPSTTATTRDPYYCSGNFIGPNCNISSDACSMSQPCLNAATCFPNYTLPLGYKCACQSGYTGINCQNDQRICKESTCWNNGTCIEINSTVSSTDGSNFVCECTEGYDGVHCELHVDLCDNITCQNNGICKTTDMVWKCICLDSTFYYGNYCQYQTNALKIKKALSKSFASVAITAIALTCSFILSMDALKYIFHIDPVEKERKKSLNQKEEAKRVVESTQPKVAIRFQYVV